ncbi:MAG: UDP-N-acetylglucosamine 1-carboxyvinyltransferase [Candidatus Komeilibacteria bacterium]|nr:UDP-N-acetylglucosamine 1-carboxyvinyltransferase [Candidatus Komeilibacteria bacterium]
MSYYIIQGKSKLHGSVKVNSTKNSTLALLCASLLNRGQTELFNFPDLEENKRIIEVLSSLGVKFSRPGNRRLLIQPPKKLLINKIDFKAASKTRAVLMLLGSLIHFFPSFKLPKSSGCKLGSRTITPYIFALENFGVTIKSKTGWFQVKRDPRIHNQEIIMYESGDTATAAVLMAAALTREPTVIKYASANYQIQELCYYLQKLGVKIEGLGTTTLTVHGVKSINKKVQYHLAEDPIEAMLFISLAALTNSSITIKGCPIDFLELELLKLKKMGFNYQILKKYFSNNGQTKLLDIKTLPSRLIAPKDKISAQPYPGLNIDNLPFFVPIATQAKGRTLIHDWVYENRAIYYNEFNRLGAKVTLADPHRVYIDGPTPLKANEIVCPPSLRPSVIILIAMLAASGKSILRNTYNIDRGYENLHERLKQLGAKIERIAEKE